MKCEFNNITNKYVLYFLVFSICLNAVFFGITINTIKKHSIHPSLGNYSPKMDYKGKKCSPFDDCR